MNVVDPPVIHFYKSDEKPYGVFSNFYPCDIVYQERHYSTSEHAFQAAKFVYPGASPRSLEYAEHLRREPNPGYVFAMARQKTKGRLPMNYMIKAYQDVHMRPNWEELKLQVMAEVLAVKFPDDEQNRLTALLLKTGNARIVEHTANDRFWGDGGDGKGLNHLGNLLMQRRAVLLQANDHHSSSASISNSN